VTLLGDFVAIIGDTPQSIPAVGIGGSLPVGPKFDTTGRVEDNRETGPTSALLMFSVRNMAGTARVHVNDFSDFTGFITPTPDTCWTTQMIAVRPNQLRSGGDNQIRVSEVTDSFEIKNLVCFYHQRS
jgi:hypothetical protein